MADLKQLNPADYSPEMKAAVKAAVRIWEDRAAGRVRFDDCPLCVAVGDIGCDVCPIVGATGETCCVDDAPFNLWDNIKRGSERALQPAKDMLAQLRSIDAMISPSEQTAKYVGPPRWKVCVTYRHNSGTKTKVHEIEELDEIHDIVEAGPHWDTVSKISVRRINADYPDLTVEEAAKL